MNARPLPKHARAGGNIKIEYNTRKKACKAQLQNQIDPNNRIVIKGAREHNLKNVDLELPRDKLIVMTGLSGSGKSSLAFDTIYADGQRRYMESLSSYARQFLGQMEKPDVDEITGLSPAISIDQKHKPQPAFHGGNGTEIYDYLRLMYARIGVPHCPICGRADYPADRGRDGRRSHEAAGAHPLSGAGPRCACPQGHPGQGAGCRPPSRFLPACASTAICTI